MALGGDQEPVRRNAIDVLLRTQNPDGSWAAFEGDDPEGCWATALAVITLRFSKTPTGPDEKALRWILDNKGREGHWLWRWKFRMVDRAVRFNPDKYGWSWFPGTVSWVIPTALSVLALKQSFPCCSIEQVAMRQRHVWPTVEHGPGARVLTRGKVTVDRRVAQARRERARVARCDDQALAGSVAIRCAVTAGR